MQHEIRVSTEDYIGNSEDKESYKNDLILALARFAYSPYLTEDGDVCFSIYTDKEIHKVTEDAEFVAKNIL